MYQLTASCRFAFHGPGDGRLVAAAHLPTVLEQSPMCTHIGDAGFPQYIIRQFPKTSVIDIHTCIRGFLNDMRYINSRFTYLLTYMVILSCHAHHTLSLGYQPPIIQKVVWVSRAMSLLTSGRRSN